MRRESPRLRPYERRFMGSSYSRDLWCWRRFNQVLIPVCSRGLGLGLRGLNSLAVRRLASFAVLALLLVGCSDTVPGGKKIVSPTPDTVIGPLPKPTVADPAAGKAVFLASGCTACHIFKPAGPT